MSYLYRLSKKERSYWAGIASVGGVVIGLSLVILIVIGFPSAIWTPLPLTATSLLQAVFSALGILGLGILVFGLGQLFINSDIDSASHDGLVINPVSSAYISGGGLIGIFAIFLFFRYIYLGIVLAVSPPLPSMNAEFIAGVSFSSDGSRVAFFQDTPGDADDEATVWDLKDTNRVFQLTGSTWSSQLELSTAALSPDGRLLATGSLQRKDGPGSKRCVWG